MKENYVFPAKFTKTKKGNIRIEFLDFPEIVAEAEAMEQAISVAQELLALTIIGYGEEGKSIPEPLYGQIDVTYIQVWLPYYKNMAKEIYIRKSVTIPEWLDILAKKNSINYSSTLVKGLKSELGIKN